MIRFEHANITVADPKATAAWLCDVFGWKIRWQGPAKDRGFSVHVGQDDAYVALFSYGAADASTQVSYETIGHLNHLAVFTEEDIDAVEDRVRKAGFTAVNHGDYDPGRRFYFHDADNIEWEVASHQPATA